MAGSLICTDQWAGWRELAMNLGTGSKEGKGKREGNGEGKSKSTIHGNS